MLMLWKQEKYIYIKERQHTSISGSTDIYIYISLLYLVLLI